jgi:hypothetical protein
MSKDPGNKIICSRCVGERYLKSKVVASGENGNCDYCQKLGKTLSIRELSEEHIRGAFDRHYVRTPLGPPESEEYVYRESEFQWDRAGEPAVDVIGWAAGLDDDAAEDVRATLEANTFFTPDECFDRDSDDEDDFSEESQYEEISADATALHYNWLGFKRTLKTETRLFNSAAKAVLDIIFDGLDDHGTRSGEKVVVSVGPEEKFSALYRARVFQSNDKILEALKRPDLELGPPPPDVATAGRMNARGVGVFYGATHPQVAISETRPPVGSRVLVARFAIIRPLRLLDLLALRSIVVKGSIFDPAHLERLKKAAFLTTLSDQISKPVMPDDEPFEYLVTQAIADYLANLAEPKLDGIIYRSVQHGKNKKNVVLFQKSARVSLLDIPAGTTISAYLFERDEDGERPDYTVFETRVAPRDKDDPDLEFGVSDFAHHISDLDDARQSTLSIDMSSLLLHHIERAEYSSTIFTPRRHQSQLSKGIKRIKSKY